MVRSTRRRHRYGRPVFALAGLVLIAGLSLARTRSTPVTPATTEVEKASDADDDLRKLQKKHLIVPVAGVARSRLVRSFNDKRDGTRTHEALDILAPRNTPVLAVEDGTIAKLFVSKLGGNTIYQFDPSEHYAYYYAHLARYADGLKDKQKVKEGDTIGYVGTSGNAPPNTPHLHFAIFRLTDEKRWWSGTAIDPFDVLMALD